MSATCGGHWYDRQGNFHWCNRPKHPVSQWCSCGCKAECRGMAGSDERVKPQTRLL